MVAGLYNPSVVRLRPELPGETLLVGGREGKCPVSSSKSLWSYQEGSGRLLSNPFPVINEETEACPDSVKVFRDISGLSSAGISGEQHPLTFELSPARRSQHLAD